MGKEYPMRDFEARDNVIRAVLHLLQADMGPADDPHFDASRECAEEGLAHAARDLYMATERMPRDDRPVGWSTAPRDGVVPVPLTRADLSCLTDALHDSIARLNNRLTAAPTGGARDRLERDRAQNSDLLERLLQERAAFERHPEKQEAAP